MERQPYLDRVRNDPMLTKRQKMEICEHVIKPALHALEQAVGMAVLFAMRINQTAEGKAQMKENNNEV